MKQKIFFACLLLAFFAAPQQAQAQFWKKLFGKEERRRPAKKNVERQPESVAKPKRKRLPEYPATKVKDRYRVDVLIPLYLEELVQDDKPAFKDRVPDKAVSGISFYEGVKLASDSLASLGYNLDIYVHDITQESLTPANLVKYKTLKGTDLIIAAVQSGQVQGLAEFAKKSAINFVSAISPSDGEVRDNPFFIMLQPTLQTHCSRIESLAFRKFSGKDIHLLYRTNNSVDSLAYSYIIADGEHSYKEISLNDSLKYDLFSEVFDSTEVNVLLMPLLDQEYAERVLKQLSAWFRGYRFEAFGMPTWKSMNIARKPDTYGNIAVNFTSPFYYDQSTKAASLVLAKYKKEFSGRPSEMVFRGYETVFWLAHLLQQYGTVFNNKLSDNMFAPFTRFDIELQWNKSNDLLYNENDHVYLYRYQAGSYTVEQ